jgi:hypothetical protein
MGLTSDSDPVISIRIPTPAGNGTASNLAATLSYAGCILYLILCEVQVK